MVSKAPFLTKKNFNELKGEATDEIDQQNSYSWCCVDARDAWCGHGAELET
jgi:hypothetical protein